MRNLPQNKTGLTSFSLTTKVLMKNNANNSTTVVSRRTRLLGMVLTLALMIPSVAVSQFNNPATVPLLTAGNFRVLAGTAVTVGATCTVTGNVGGTSVTNNGTVTGTTDVANAAVTTGLSDLAASITNAAGRGADSTLVAVELGGLTLGRGVYAGPGTFGINGTLTLTGTASDVFIFKTSTTLITGATCSVALTGGAQWINVFWHVGSSATINGDFKGNILASTSITQETGTIDGRTLARDGAVTLNGTAAMPVQFTAFAVTSNRMNAVLHWSTATEVNNFGFEIERRQTARWEKVGFVQGAGTSSSPRDYSYADINLSPGRYAYRIKQVDKDRTFSYQGSAEVEVGLAAKKFELGSNYPNPFNPATTMEFTLGDDGPALLRVYNMLGQTVITLFDGNAQAGRLYQVKFDASRLPSGLYFATLESGNQRMMQKMVLMK